MTQKQTELVNTHEAHCKAIGAEIYNLGWYVEDNAICSKTSVGIVTTELVSGKAFEVRQYKHSVN